MQQPSDLETVWTLGIALRLAEHLRQRCNPEVRETLDDVVAQLRRELLAQLGDGRALAIEDHEGGIRLAAFTFGDPRQVALPVEGLGRIHDGPMPAGANMLAQLSLDDVQTKARAASMEVWFRVVMQQTAEKERD